MDASMILTLIATTIALLALVWSYGSAGVERRAIFWAWVAEITQAAKPATIKIAVRIAFFIPFLISAYIVWSSTASIYQFLVSTEPLRRVEVFNLILWIFNTFSYFLVGFTFLLLTLSPPSRSKSDNGWEAGDVLHITCDGSLADKELVAAIRSGLSVRVVSVSSKKVSLAVETPGFSLKDVCPLHLD